ncbi:hypothetical protein OIDMADRAFT_16598 [Oidiodendron maius Zn]|uniref:Uncharacterized protein n=1 Tax=Oidiodendron maius (strain Zn) TaxID=913774 RepID=A0A0C3HJF1_OIDMZ|nr:hypothetical protein OIDMADRAFT_16598 [Oidiodendron maius Zn]
MARPNREQSNSTYYLPTQEANTQGEKNLLPEAIYPLGVPGGTIKLGHISPLVSSLTV